MSDHDVRIAARLRAHRERLAKAVRLALEAQGPPPRRMRSPAAVPPEWGEINRRVFAWRRRAGIPPGWHLSAWPSSGPPAPGRPYRIVLLLQRADAIGPSIPTRQRACEMSQAQAISPLLEDLLDDALARLLNE